MENVLHKKRWVADTNPSHVEPPHIPLIKEIFTGKLDVDYVKLKLRRYPTSSTAEFYEFMMYLFDHGNPEDFLLFIWNFQMTLEAIGTLETEVKVQYLRTLVCGKPLRQFDLLSADVENRDTFLNVDSLLMGLAWYFSYEFAFLKACSAPLYEKIMQPKGEALCRVLNGSE